MWDKAPVTQQVARKLQELIRSGQLKAGEKLPSQRILAEQLNVARPTLREALLTLETLGLVRTLPARGTFVIDPHEAAKAPPQWRYKEAYSQQDVMQLRLMVEGEICHLSAGVISADTLSQLAEAAQHFALAWEQGDLVAHVQADLEFHRLIAHSCPNRMLRDVYNSYQVMLTETQRQPIAQTQASRMALSIAEHRKILAALQARDGVLARQEMQNHIRNTAIAAEIAL